MGESAVDVEENKVHGGWLQVDWKEASIKEASILAGGTGFGAMVAAGGGVRVTSEVAGLFAAMPARAGATFISFNRARTSAVKPGKDATGVKSGAWSLPTRIPE